MVSVSFESSTFIRNRASYMFKQKFVVTYHVMFGNISYDHCNRMKLSHHNFLHHNDKQSASR